MHSNAPKDLHGIEGASGGQKTGFAVRAGEKVRGRYEKNGFMNYGAFHVQWGTLWITGRVTIFS